MQLVPAAKSTKPGSKATAKRGTLVNGKPPRVPMGAVHYIDLTTPAGSMNQAVCGESSLVVIDGTIDDDFSEVCEQCAEQQWAAQFETMQNDLLK